MRYFLEMALPSSQMLLGTVDGNSSKNIVLGALVLPLGGRIPTQVMFGEPSAIISLWFPVVWSIKRVGEVNEKAESR